MRPPGMEEPVSLEPVKSEAVRWVIEQAIAGGNRVLELAEWSKALVAHMEQGLTDALKAEVMARYPELEYYEQAGSPHNQPDEGFIEDGSAVSFPRPRQT